MQTYDEDLCQRLREMGPLGEEAAERIESLLEQLVCAAGSFTLTQWAEYRAKMQPK